MRVRCGPLWCHTHLLGQTSPSLPPCPGGPPCLVAPRAPSQTALHTWRQRGCCHQPQPRRAKTRMVRGSRRPLTYASVLVAASAASAAQAVGTAEALRDDWLALVGWVAEAVVRVRRVVRVWRVLCRRPGCREGPRTAAWRSLRRLWWAGWGHWKAAGAPAAFEGRPLGQRMAERLCPTKGVQRRG